MDSQPIVIATSIAPKNIDKQLAAIQTWLQAGFEVISLNSAAEIALLRGQFEQVKFIPAPRDAQQKFGKPFVYINDMLTQLSGFDADIVGIVNSDIYFRNGAAIYSLVVEAYRNSVIFSSRVDIDSLDSDQGSVYRYGFDAFFFDRKLVQCFPESEYCLGVPWWDYWVPWTGLKQGIPLKHIRGLELCHLTHKMNYSMEIWRTVGVDFADEFAPGFKDWLSTQSGFTEHDIDREIGHVITNNFLRLLQDKSEQLHFAAE